MNQTYHDIYTLDAFQLGHAVNLPKKRKIKLNENENEISHYSKYNYIIMASGGATTA